MCDVFVCGCLRLRTWQRFQAHLAGHVRVSARGQLFIFHLQLAPSASAPRASCCAPTCASGAMAAWTARARLPLKRSDPEALRQPSHLLSPTSDTSHPRCFFPTTPFPPPPARPVVLRRCQTSSLLHCASGVGTAVRKIGFAFACVSASHTGENSELESGPVDLRMWKNIAGGIYCFCLTHKRTARV